VSTSDHKNDDLDSGWAEPTATDPVKTEEAGENAAPAAGVDPTAATAASIENPVPSDASVADPAQPRSAEDDERAFRARDFVEALLAKMGMEAVADLVEPEPGDRATEIRIEIEGKDSGRVIGKKGQVLAAIQHIVNRVVNRPGLERMHVVVDAEGYRQRREDTLATMAQRLGKRALEEGKIITFEPMSPRDRRIVHLALAKFPGVVTKSDGEGEGRRVQIIPVRR
jgi:spoIIIJ-associated protein